MIVLAPGAPAVSGLAAATAMMEDLFKQVTLEVKYRSEEIVVMGDWAFDRGTAWKHARVTWNASSAPRT